MPDTVWQIVVLPLLRELLTLDDAAKRSFYEREAANSGWSVRAYVLIELKTTKLMASAVGQVNEYLNYFGAEVNDEYDNPPIGIILCTDKNDVRAEYALGGLDNAIFASTYTLRLPDKAQLEERVRRTIEANERRALEAGPTPEADK